MKQQKVLIADKMHDSIISLLKGVGVEPYYQPEILRTELLASLQSYDGLIIRSKTPVDRELIDAGSSLKFVARAGAGVDKVDWKYLEEKQIHLINAPEGNRDSVGEHTLGMLLGLLHRLAVSAAQIKNFRWDRESNRGIELKGKTVGIFGVGNMGSTFGKKLLGLECEVIGYDKYKSDFSEKSIQGVQLEEFMHRTEILSIHVPLTEETRGLFNKTFFSRFSKLKIVLNTSRGEVLNTMDLLSLLQEEKLVGAGLDVLENEKLATYTEEERKLLNELTSHPNVMVSPHIAGWSFESYERINQVLVEKIQGVQT